MLRHGFSSGPTAAENAVLDEISRILAGHLDYWSSRRQKNDRDATSPVLIQIDGPGRSLFLEKIAGLLDPREAGAHRKRKSRARWTVIRFDAWQYQRVAPPWWWLIKTIDQQLRDRIRSSDGNKGLRRWRTRDIAWRIKLAAGDLRAAAPALLIAACLFATAVLLSGKSEIVEILKWVAAAVAAVTAVVSIGYSAANALRRHLLVASPAGAKAVLQTSDPMRDLMERYRFLIKSSGTDVAILIDNLDRCRGKYVVELLEGIQTLFRDETRDTTRAMVVYIVAADRGWLCDSYLTVYDEFKDAAHEPGRRFGQAFLEKVFDFLLRIPTVPAATSLAAEHVEQHGLKARAKGIITAKREGEVREQLAELEGDDAPAGQAPAPPNQDLRLYAVRRLAKLENMSPTKSCQDTEAELRELTAIAEPGPATVRHLVAGYCVQRTALLLGGHAIDHDPGAIKRLGLWTILTLRWPLLAEWLAQHPESIAGLRDGRLPPDARDGIPPADARDGIAAVYALREVQRFGVLAEAHGLDADAVRRFAIPIDVMAAATAQRDREDRATAAAS